MTEGKRGGRSIRVFAILTVVIGRGLQGMRLLKALRSAGKKERRRVGCAWFPPLIDKFSVLAGEDVNIVTVTEGLVNVLAQTGWESGSALNPAGDLLIRSLRSFGCMSPVTQSYWLKKPRRANRLRVAHMLVKPSQFHSQERSLRRVILRVSTSFGVPPDNS